MVKVASSFVAVGAVVIIYSIISCFWLVVQIDHQYQPPPPPQFQEKGWWERRRQLRLSNNNASDGTNTAEGVASSPDFDKQRQGNDGDNHNPPLLGGVGGEISVLQNKPEKMVEGKMEPAVTSFARDCIASTEQMAQQQQQQPLRMTMQEKYFRHNNEACTNLAAHHMVQKLARQVLSNGLIGDDDKIYNNSVLPPPIWLFAVSNETMDVEVDNFDVIDLNDDSSGNNSINSSKETAKDVHGQLWKLQYNKTTCRTYSQTKSTPVPAFASGIATVWILVDLVDTSDNNMNNTVENIRKMDEEIITRPFSKAIAFDGDSSDDNDHDKNDNENNTNANIGGTIKNLLLKEYSQEQQRRTTTASMKRTRTLTATFLSFQYVRSIECGRTLEFYSVDGGRTTNMLKSKHHHRHQSYMNTYIYRPPLVRIEHHDDIAVADATPERRGNGKLDQALKILDPIQTDSQRSCTRDFKNQPTTQDIDDAHYLSQEQGQYFSGNYTVVPNKMTHVGSSWMGKHLHVKTDRFYIWARQAVYDPKKASSLAHQPHIERPLEICAVIEGRVNYALGRTCKGTFDIIRPRQYHVVGLVPGSVHNAAPDHEVEGRHLCFKILPLQPGRAAQMVAKDGTMHDGWLNVSREWSSVTLDVDPDHYFDETGNRNLVYVDRSIEQKKKGINVVKKDGYDPSYPPPGFDHLKVKQVLYQENEVSRGNGKSVDRYDLLVLALSDHVEVLQDNGGGTGHVISTPLPKHQYAIIPAGVKHGFRAVGGKARILFIEIA